jgi:uncharacterized protein YlxP (DUF503 family)
MVVRGLRIASEFNVAVAEVAITISGSGVPGIVTVSNDEKHADQELAAVVNEIERLEPGLITRTEVEFRSEAAG